MEDAVSKNPFCFQLPGFQILFKIDKTIWPKMKKAMEKNMKKEVDDWIGARMMNAKKIKERAWQSNVIYTTRKKYFFLRVLATTQGAYRKNF